MANANATILPDCVNGIQYEGRFPPCKVNNDGVGLGEKFVIKLPFKDIYKTNSLVGRFQLDETTGGSYKIAISEIPNDYNVSGACRDLQGGFPKINYLNQAEIDRKLSIKPSLDVPELLKTQCLLDMNKLYYLNVESIRSCKKDDPTKLPCWGSVLIPGYQFNL